KRQDITCLSAGRESNVALLDTNSASVGSSQCPPLGPPARAASWRCPSDRCPADCAASPLPTFVVSVACLCMASASSCLLLILAFHCPPQPARDHHNRPGPT